jgi:excinuclease ABC subunit C
MDFQEKLSRVPASPGIYIMKGPRERIIYVGKAKNLRNRLRSYFQKSPSLDSRKAKMMEDIREFDYIITENELEALALEANFIKRFKPRFNVILRDDKNYPYLKLSINEEWPRLEVVRKTEKDGALYFGPYIPSGAMREMVRFIRRHFPVRTCSYNLNKPFRPCVQYQMGRCLAPCSSSLRSEADRDTYLEIVKEIRAFLEGEKRELTDLLREQMQRFSDEQRYEEAATVRDRLKALQRAWESQRVIAPELGEVDVIGLYRELDEASFYMLFIRRGMVVGQKDFFLKKVGEVEDKELVPAFLEQFYSKEMLIPARIIVPYRAHYSIQKKWLSKKHGSPVRIGYAQGDLEGKVLKMADENALYSFSKHKNRKVDVTLQEIKNMLHLDSVPQRIGAVDVSNISGAEAVGAVVVFEDGRFVRDNYRRFKIKGVEGIDDFAMIGEVVERYLKNIAKDKEKVPQLILIDGGRGQLTYAEKAVKGFDLPVEIAAIAKARNSKQNENVKKGDAPASLDRIFIPGRVTPIPLEPFLPSSHLLQKIRDEVHRFAIDYHKKLRTKRTLRSPLENIKGIGKTRRLVLLKHFGSVDAVRQASVDELSVLKGMNRKVAEELKSALKDN